MLTRETLDKINLAFERLAHLDNSASFSLMNLKMEIEKQNGEEGSMEKPFTRTFNTKIFKRHDSTLTLGVCERDQGFELIVENVEQRRHYFIDDTATMQRTW